MDVFAAVVSVLIAGGPVAWVLYRNQRDYNLAKDTNRAKNSDPLDPYVTRVSGVWEGAPAHMRNIMLESSGVTDAANRQLLISRSWRGLPDEVQVALTKFQILTEIEISNPMLMASMTRSEERKQEQAQSNGYPTETQMKTLWDAFKEGPNAFKNALAKNSKPSHSSIEPMQIEESHEAAESTPVDAMEGTEIDDRSDDSAMRSIGTLSPVAAEPSRPGGSRPSAFMFIPEELDVAGRPELRKLPKNIVFAKVGTNAGVSILGSALYEPDLSSFDFRGSDCSLTYRNKHGGDGRVRITYHVDKQTWVGEKSVEGKSVGVAFGADWKQFFMQLTLLGLAKGEACVMDRILEEPAST